MENRAFSVADNTFCMELPAEVWSKLDNYSPFRIMPQKLYAFELHYAHNIDCSNLQQVFVDASDKDMPRIEVGRCDTDWVFRFSEVRDGDICLTLRTNDTFTNASFCVDDIDRRIRFGTDNATMLMFAIATAKSGVLEFHASVIKKDNEGYLFLGKSGTGKSTHSRLWLSAIAGTSLLNDDNPIVRIANGKAYVFGSPWSGKTPCYKNDCVPVKAIVRLHQAKENAIRKLSPVEAYASVMPSCSGLKIDPQMADIMHNNIAALIGSVNCFSLGCLPNDEAAILCHKITSKK